MVCTQLFSLLAGTARRGCEAAAFTLVDNKVTTKGVLIARYQRAGNVVRAILRWIHPPRRKSRGAIG